MRLVMASANPHKVAEIAAILTSVGDETLEVLPRPADLADVVEDGETLLDNARLKAVAVCEHSGAASVADDTGLEVDALGGAPGVRSARYSEDVEGEGNATDATNLAKLLAELSAGGHDDVATRTARFRTVALVRFLDGREVRADGVVEGHIAHDPTGNAGFGYDPVFIPAEGDGRSFAEMTDEEKNAISHRGRAFRQLATLLAATP